MTSFKQHSKSAVYYLSSSVVAGLCPVLTFPFLLRVLSPEAWGLVALAQVYGVYAAGLANVGLGVIYERNFFKYSERKDAGKLFYTLLLFVGILLVGIGFITFRYSSPIAKFLFKADEHASFLLPALLGAGFINLCAFHQTYYRNAQRPSSYFKLSLFQAGGMAGLSLFFVLVLHWGAAGILWAQCIAGAVVFFGATLVMLTHLPFGLNRKMLFEALWLGFPLTPRIFLKTVGKHLDKYFISLFATVGNVGVYSIGQKIANLVFVMTTAIENVYAPHVYRIMFSRKEEGGAEIGRFLTPFFYISTGVCLVTALFTEEILRIMASPAFKSANVVVILFVAYYALLFFMKQPQLIYKKKIVLAMALSFINMGLSASFCYVFTKQWGMLGAAWSVFVSGVLYIAIGMMIYQRSYRIVWEYRKIWSIIIVFLAASFATYFLEAVGVMYVPRLGIKFLFLGGYVFMGNRIMPLLSKMKELFLIVLRKVQEEK